MPNPQQQKRIRGQLKNFCESQIILTRLNSQLSLRRSLYSIRFSLQRRVERSMVMVVAYISAFNWKLRKSTKHLSHYLVCNSTPVHPQQVYSSDPKRFLASGTYTYGL
jgi:hypothetical protein